MLITSAPPAQSAGWVAGNGGHFFNMPFEAATGGTSNTAKHVQLVPIDDPGDPSPLGTFEAGDIAASYTSTCSATIGGDLYLFAPGYPFTSRKWSKVSGEWSTLAASNGSGFGYWAACTNGTDIYLKGGEFSAATQLLKYSPASDTWTTLAASVSCGIGVSITHYQGSLFVTKGGGSTDVLEFDLSTLAWVTSAVPAIPSGVTYCSAIGSDGGGNLYVRTYTSGLYVHAIGSNSWTALTSAPSYFFQGSIPELVIRDGLIYTPGNGTDINAYNVGANSWTTIDLGIYKTGRIFGVLV